MRKSIRVMVLSALVAAAIPVVMAPATAAEAAAKPAARYSVTTTLVGTLLDDPAANALLKRMIPSVYANEMFHTAGRDLTLQAIQQYEGDALSDANLAKIQAELDMLPAKAAPPGKG
jgi:para-nitrobenzyl esterase